MSGIDNNFRNMASRISALQSRVETEVKELIEYYTGEIEVEAFRAAPGSGDQIRVEGGSIKYEDVSEKRRGQTPIAQAIGYIITDNGFSGTIYVEQSAGDIAIYVEMGTGQSAKSYLADKDPEWQALARKYYVNGLGTIIAQPYVLPAVLRNEPKLIADLQKLMNNLSL